MSANKFKGAILTNNPFVILSFEKNEIIHLCRLIFIILNIDYYHTNIYIMDQVEEQ